MALAGPGCVFDESNSSETKRSRGAEPEYAIVKWASAVRESTGKTVVWRAMNLEPEPRMPSIFGPTLPASSGGVHTPSMTKASPPSRVEASATAAA